MWNVMGILWVWDVVGIVWVWEVFAMLTVWQPMGKAKGRNVRGKPLVWGPGPGTWDPQAGRNAG